MVSLRVSPLVALVTFASEKPMTRAPSRFAAGSNNSVATTFPLRISRLGCFSNSCAIRMRYSISSFERLAIVTKFCLFIDIVLINIYILCAKLSIFFGIKMVFSNIYCIFAFKKQNNCKMRKKFVRFLWGIIMVSVLIVALMFTAIWNGWIGYMPDMEELQNPIDRYATQVYSADGKVIGTWNMNKENRIHVGFNKMS